VNTRQKFILWGWIAAVTTIALFPPWTQAVGVDTYSAGPGFYHFIFASSYGRVDVTRLLIMWFLPTIVAAGLYFTWAVRGFAPTSPGEAS
jgi:hypothetical protein